MKGFLWTMIVVFGIEIVGKSCMLLTQDTHRNLKFLPWDILIAVGLIVWAATLLP